MSDKTFKFKVWSSDMENKDATTIQASYSDFAAEEFANARLIGFESIEELEGVEIFVSDPFGLTEKFKIEVTMEPVYHVRRSE